MDAKPDKGVKIHHSEDKGTTLQEEDIVKENVESIELDKGEAMVQEEEQEKEEKIQDASEHDKEGPSKEQQERIKNLQVIKYEFSHGWRNNWREKL